MREKPRSSSSGFFGGMTVEEIANTMDIGATTVRRDMEFAKVWLARELGINTHE